MAETPRGIVYPESGAHTRLWEHFQTLADTTDDAIDAAAAAAVLPDSGLVDVPYRTGYMSAGEPLRVRKVGKVCHITGTVTGTNSSLGVSTGGGDVAYLPAGFLPPAGSREIFPITTQNPATSQARGYITSTGTLRIYIYSNATAYIDFNTTYFTA